MVKGTSLGSLPYVNAGRGNSGNGHWIKFLQRERDWSTPRVVVLQGSDNDIADNLEDRLFNISADGGLGESPSYRQV